jgi:hypothetical protein
MVSGTRKPNTKEATHGSVYRSRRAFEKLHFGRDERRGPAAEGTVIDTNAKVLIETVRSIGGTLHLCFEEGTLSNWIYELLEPHVDKLVVVQPRREHTGPRATQSTRGRWRRTFVQESSKRRCSRSRSGSIACAKRCVRSK